MFNIQIPWTLDWHPLQSKQAQCIFLLPASKQLCPFRHSVLSLHCFLRLLCRFGLYISFISLRHFTRIDSVHSLPRLVADRNQPSPYVPTSLFEFVVNNHPFFRLFTVYLLRSPSS
jgi:hypothetical protein